ncbi:hypothetical protein Celal_3393 [Cellulophaga algicola DSM 14237]|uniref:YD repeat-containing protein n=2 Tax=Cellulophaga TaxID=104264 RepID=E6X6U5_CELAD|nr:hypothetical protein [Cellulophaga algicola]ADV50658.1 hypothetical protein Celal_3393 [Cellulophaga algicola DSM 14237]
MIKNYPLKMLRTFLVPAFMFAALTASAQKAKIFTISDFDLVGKVKTCFVITDYGKEEFNFNEKGVLTKLTTRYNEADYDITYYRFVNEEISEKRVENYRDGVFDKSTSIANIYSYDSIPSGKKITENIISYTKEFLDQYEYFYDAADKLVEIKRNNDSGIESTMVTYTTDKGEATTTYTINNEVQKTVRVSDRKTKLKGVQRIELTKEFLEGKPSKALEQIFNQQDKVVSENFFDFDTSTNAFFSKELKTYSYNTLGMLTEVKTQHGKLVSTKEYIYQYDNGDKGNWIKQIITPDNTFISRKIKYYEVAAIEE